MSPSFEKIKSKIIAKSALFANQGSVVATWRKHGNTLLGPYFRLRYYENSLRRSIYIGRSKELALQVRRLLANLQVHRISLRLRMKIRKSLRVHKKQLQNDLLVHGYRIKGFEIHKTKTNSQ
jgi:hypothetical protein